MFLPVFNFQNVPTSFQLIANYENFAFQFCKAVISRLAYHVFLMEKNSGITPPFAPIGAMGHLLHGKRAGPTLGNI